MEWAMGAGVLVLVITGVVGGIMTKGLSSAVAELAVVETERAEPAQVIARSSEVYEGKVFGNELPREEVFDDEIFREDGAVIAYSGDAGYEKPLGESGRCELQALQSPFSDGSLIQFTSVVSSLIVTVGNCVNTDNEGRVVCALPC